MIGIILLILIPSSMVINQLQILFSELELEALSIENVTKRIQQTLVESKMSQLIDLDMLKEQMDRFLELLGQVFGSILSGSSQMLVNFALAIVFCYFISAYYRSIRSIILAELQIE
jgi:predicted PurR-regulated permease PerM